ncbi:hypothetical protein GcM1_154001 [Golovinomyces cichoracearum]|uniref:Uncharacterized protein n=1 Tax=Golovinomyces cichoracearum TaxID=62708 RepID=A0A420JAC5_9PEZI|nr:hypothetical protein GcM1_154001 [Golovinomyces cichoracearum]
MSRFSFSPQQASATSSQNSSSRSFAPFTAEMQDRQARNKDPFSSSDDSDESMCESGANRKKPVKESYQVLQKRREAAVILDSPELLMMYSQARCDSLAGTRHYFTKMLAGYLESEDDLQASEPKSASRNPTN